MVIYLPGFLSSPASHKARLLAQHMADRGLADRFWCPALSHDPREALAQIEAGIARAATPPTLVGSSLGGLYAAALAQTHGLRAVLINPAVLASLTLSSYIGRQTWLATGEPFDFTADHVAALAEIESRPVRHQEALWLLLETGDEVLDYRAALARYPRARHTVIEGGDHSFLHFAEYLDDILEFAGLRAHHAPGTGAPV